MTCWGAVTGLNIGMDVMIGIRLLRPADSLLILY